MINKVILVGRLGAGVDFRQGNNFSVASLPLATSSKSKNANGEWVENTEWHNVTLFNKQAEVARDYLKKGSLIYVEGRLKTSKYQDKQGIDRYKTEVLVDKLQMLERASEHKSEPKNKEKESVPEQVTEELIVTDIPF